MAGRLAMLAVFAALTATPALAASAPPLFPDEVRKAGDDWTFPQFHEAPIWTPAGRSGSMQRIRMFIQGVRIGSWMIRLDQDSSGQWRGYFREHDGHELLALHRFTVKEADLAELLALIARAKLWSIYPQFYVGDSKEICLDGETVVLEKVDRDGYRYAEGNAQCTLGPAQRAVAAKLLDMAHHPELERVVE
jgi:hypothetical protein